ncbi:MFS transporter [Ideonella alba]|uniref:MFS transporter n=1 Tax=Ideonella alba TaxID=2824118 RepID=A0A941BJW2_9BURK|nr:MFS transporter [Ideonella alba]MBQ0929509.1 MFS transporter [Ideonella alba]
MTRTSSIPGVAALMVAHCAGMVDLVALPVWVGTLIGRYGLDPQQAGLLATLFLAGAVVASSALAPVFHRVSWRLVATAGFAVAAGSFWWASGSAAFSTLALCHALAGMATGAALSVTHGTIARSAHPHRLFAGVGAALGVFAVVFLGATPPLVERLGGPVLFAVFAGVMAVAAVVSLLAFPVPDRALGPAHEDAAPAPMPRAVWFGIAGIAGMGLVQSMTFSFLERVGTERGFGLAAITGVLVALGVVNLFPAALAGALERRWPARRVLQAGPVLQALLVVVIMNSARFEPYAAAASVFAAVMIFTHTFAFGLLAQLDRSGRALAATPAMLMTGAAIGPILGGTLVKGFGYGALGVAALLIGACALASFLRLPAPAAPRQPQGQA